MYVVCVCCPSFGCHIKQETGVRTASRKIPDDMVRPTARAVYPCPLVLSEEFRGLQQTSIITGSRPHGLRDQLDNLNEFEDLVYQERSVAPNLSTFFQVFL